MKRKTKNFLMIILLLGLIGTLTFTIYNSNIQLEIPKENSNMETPPEMSENSNMETPPEMSENSNMKNPPEMMENSFISSAQENIQSSILIIQVAAISLILIYLIMSRFNKKTFKETFKNKDKIIIYILFVIILSSLVLKLESNYKKTPSNEMNNAENNKEQTYSASTKITEDKNIDEGSYESESADENAILVSGNINVNLSNITVNKTGDSSGADTTSFYGINSAILAKDKANLTLENIIVNTNAIGANGVFSYGGSATTNNTSSDGTTITIKNSKITTSKDNSGGIMVTGGGLMNAYNLDITTSGTSSAAIRTDKGGGTVNIDGGTYETNGVGSPSIYSVADIKVSNASLVSNKSEGIIIEGKNSVTLDSCTLKDNNSKLNGQSTTYKNIFLYQSMSGDAASGSATFTSKNSTIETNNGDTFYITNTKAIINLENNKIINNDKEGNFLRAQKDSWGTSAANGGDVTLNMINQVASGNIVIDEISTLNMNLEENSYYEGTINQTNEAKEINLVLDETSKIKLTGDSYITSLDSKKTSNIDFNGYKLYVNGKAMN